MVKNEFFWNNSKNIDIWILRKELYWDPLWPIDPKATNWTLNSTRCWELHRIHICHLSHHRRYTMATTCGIKTQIQMPVYWTWKYNWPIYLYIRHTTFKLQCSPLKVNFLGPEKTTQRVSLDQIFFQSLWSLSLNLNVYFIRSVWNRFTLSTFFT